MNKHRPDLGELPDNEDVPEPPAPWVEAAQACMSTPDAECGEKFPVIIQTACERWAGEMVVHAEAQRDVWKKRFLAVYADRNELRVDKLKLITAMEQMAKALQAATDPLSDERNRHRAEVFDLRQKVEAWKADSDRMTDAWNTARAEVDRLTNELKHANLGVEVATRMTNDTAAERDYFEGQFYSARAELENVFKAAIAIIDSHAQDWEASRAELETLAINKTARNPNPK